MPRPLKPWFHKRKNAWVIEPQGRITVLAPGPKNGESKRQAEKALKVYQAECAANPPLAAGLAKLTVAGLIDRYLDFVKPTQSERTWYERQRMLQLFVQFCIDHDPPIRLVKDCRPPHLAEFINAHPTWRSRDTKAEAAKAIKAAFNWGKEAGIAPPNPFVGKLASYTFGASRRPMTEGEFSAIIEACGPKQQRLREILHFCYLTGARPGEATTARWSDLDSEHGIITLKDHKTARSQKSYAPRVIVLDHEASQLLLVIRQRQPDTEFIFTSQRGRPYHRNSVQQNLRRLRRKIDLPEDIKLYGCRHGFATRAILNHTDLATLGRLLGHTKESRATGHYVHLADQGRHLREAVQQINRPFSTEGV